MYEHRGTFNVVFQVTTAAAVLAAAAHPYQISLFVLLCSFQNHPKVSIVFEIHIIIKNCVSVHRHTDSENVQTCKRHHKLVCSPCTLEKHNIHAMSLGGTWWSGPMGRAGWANLPWRRAGRWARCSPWVVHGL